MTQPFNDELLSAYLDGELPAAELAAVEEHLATSAADRELLDELRSLRSELQGLPKSAARDGFADRVVAAAVVAKENSDGLLAGSKAARPGPLSKKRWPYWAGALALTTAACVVLIVAPWRGGAPTIVEGQPNSLVSPAMPTLATQLIEQLRSNVPGEGEAVVVRLRVASRAPLGQTLDMALAEAGILQRAASDTASGAVQIGAAYRQQLLEKHGVTQPGPPSPELLESTVAAAEAVFVEASLSQLEQVVAVLSSDPSRALELATETKLAVTLPPQRTAEGEGESGSGAGSSGSQSRNFSQRLNAGMFRLEKRENAAPTQPVAAPAIAATTPVRVLILVEQISQ